MQACHPRGHENEANRHSASPGPPSPNQNDRRHREKPSPKNSNPLQTGILDFIKQHLSPSTLAEHGLSNTDINTLTKSLPKRYTIYPPLLLLPANAFSVPPAWGALYAALDSDQQQQQRQRETLFACLSRSFSRYGVTHIAINAPIAPTDSHGRDNRVRSPSGLIPLYGDFGPLPTTTTTTTTTSSNTVGSATVDVESGDDGLLIPDTQALTSAFWVRTVQNHGIVQVWAPLYTMFSRGNITEKARILGYEGTFEGLDEDSLQGSRVADISVVDMYAGIGYFVFSYLKRGVKRVWGFEINGWSIEGLRRGCEENGWGCKIVRVGSDGRLEVEVDGKTNTTTVVGFVAELTDSDRVVVFHGDNSIAADILLQIQSAMESRNSWNEIRHVNLGLLPSSRPAWENACRILDPVKGGWLHVHENVDVQEISRKKMEITAELKRIGSHVLTSSVSAECRHVELVKTYAPGVMHCVFDIAVTPEEGAA